MNLWIVGKVLNEDGTEWEFCGVFDSEERAIKACKDDNYFVGPAILNQELPEKTVKWPKAYYPKVKKEME